MQSILAPPLLPPKIKNSYKEIKLQSNTSYYKVYDAISLADHEKCTIFALDIKSPIVEKDYDAAATLFVQEIFRMCSRTGNNEFIYTQSFEIHDSSIAVAMKHCHPMTAFEKVQRVNPRIDLEKMMYDVISDISYTHSKLKIELPSIDSSKIYYASSSNNFFLVDWMCGNSSTGKNSEERRQDFIYHLGLTILEHTGVDPQEWEELPKLNDNQSYESSLEDMLDGVSIPVSVHKLVTRMLLRDVNSRITIEEILAPYTTSSNKELESLDISERQRSVQRLVLFNLSEDSKEKVTVRLSGLWLDIC